MAHQWNTLPATLAKDMAPKIAAETRKKAGKINRDVVSTIKEKVVEEISICRDYEPNSRGCHGGFKRFCKLQ